MSPSGVIDTLTLPSLRDGPLPLPQGERGVRFAGYAAVFDRPDKGGDVVRKGAFLGALERAGEIPLLWQHKPGAVIGRIEHLSEDARGLRVIAAVGDKRAAGLLGSGKVDGLSGIGCGRLRRPAGIASWSSWTWWR